MHSRVNVFLSITPMEITVVDHGVSRSRAGRINLTVAADAPANLPTIMVFSGASLGLAPSQRQSSSETRKPVSEVRAASSLSVKISPPVSTGNPFCCAG